jgi:dihydrolipoamide dehydrogenase
MYDLIVIGAGPAGYEAALTAAKLNKNVLLVEKNIIGGTCLNYGCIPTKSLLAQSKKYKDLFTLNTFGVECDNPTFNYKQMLANKNKTVDRLVKGIEFLLKKGKVEILYGEATLIDKNSIKVENEIYMGHYILVATGSSSAKLNIPGFENCIDSNELLDTDLTNIKQVIIIGGGVIGVEIATILSNLNIKVIIIEAQNQLIPNSDEMAASRLKRLLNKSGVSINLNSFVKKIEKGIVYTDKKQFEGDLILSCVGRVPNIGNLDPNNLLLKDKSFIKVNDDFQTNLVNIFAVGDCVRGWQLAHYASSCAINVVNKLFDNLFKREYSLNLKSVPRCIYTSDEISIIGEDPDERDIVVQSDFVANPRALIDNQNRGFVKLIFTREGYFKGGTIMCSRASDMINILVSALNNHLTISQMKKDIFPHPSFSESFKDVLNKVNCI